MSDYASRSSDSAAFKPRNLVINSSRRWIGEAAHCIMLVEGLRARVLPVILVCRKGYALESAAEELGIPHYALRMKGNFTGIDDLRDLLALRSLIEKHHIDIIHCHRGKDHWLSACTRLFIRRKPAIVRTRHVTVPVKNHIFNRWLFRYGTDLVIAVSKSAAASFGALPLPKPPSVIYAAVDSGRFSPEKRSDAVRQTYGIPESDPGAPLIGLIGRIQRIKGQSVFVKAAAKVLKRIPNAHFVLVGRALEERKKALLHLAQQNALFDKLIIAGYVKETESLIASLDVGVVASLGSEGSSRITMEYMATGVPIVATRVGGIPEILEDGALGRLVEPGDPDALAGAIIEVILEREVSRKKAAAALKKARQFLSPERFIDEILHKYREVFGSHK